MAWVHIEDNAKAWELYQAGLLWFGDGTDQDTRAYVGLGWDRDRWMLARFDGEAHRRNYILTED